MAALDADRITGSLEVRHAAGDEDYLSFSGEIEHPEPGEVIFADDAGRAHARRWTHRQSRTSAVSGSTTSALIITEALHATALADIQALQANLADALATTGHTRPFSAILSQDAPTFTYR